MAAHVRPAERPPRRRARGGWEAGTTDGTSTTSSATWSARVPRPQRRLPRVRGRRRLAVDVHRQRHGRRPRERRGHPVLAAAGPGLPRRAPAGGTSRCGRRAGARCPRGPRARTRSGPGARGVAVRRPAPLGRLRARTPTSPGCSAAPHRRPRPLAHRRPLPAGPRTGCPVGRAGTSDEVVPVSQTEYFCDTVRAAGDTWRSSWSPARTTWRARTRRARSSPVPDLAGVPAGLSPQRR